MRQRVIPAEGITGGIPRGAVGVLTWMGRKNGEASEKSHKTDLRAGEKALV